MGRRAHRRRQPPSSRGAPPACRRFPRRVDDCAPPPGAIIAFAVLPGLSPGGPIASLRERQAKEVPCTPAQFAMPPSLASWSLSCRRGPSPAVGLAEMLRRACAGRRRAMAIAPTLPSTAGTPSKPTRVASPTTAAPGVTPPWTRQGSCRRRGSSKRPSPAVVRPCSTQAALLTATIPPGRSPRAAGDCGQPTKACTNVCSRTNYQTPHEYRGRDRRARGDGEPSKALARSARDRDQAVQMTGRKNYREKKWPKDRAGAHSAKRTHPLPAVSGADAPGSSPWPEAAGIDERPTTLRGAFCGFQCRQALVHLQADQFVEGAAVDPVAAAMITANDNPIERIRRQVFRRPRANGTLHGEPPLLVYNMPAAGMAVNPGLWGLSGDCVGPQAAASAVAAPQRLAGPCPIGVAWVARRSGLEAARSLLCGLGIGAG